MKTLVAPRTHLKKRDVSEKPYELSRETINKYEKN